GEGGGGVNRERGAHGPDLGGLEEACGTNSFRAPVLPRRDLIDELDAPGRADTAGRALAARFYGAELHGEAGLLGHVHGVVEHHHAAMTDQPLAGGESLVVEWRVEQLARAISAERPAALHGPNP